MHNCSYAAQERRDENKSTLGRPHDVSRSLRVRGGARLGNTTLSLEETPFSEVEVGYALGAPHRVPGGAARTGVHRCNATRNQPHRTTFEGPKPRSGAKTGYIAFRPTVWPEPKSPTCHGPHGAQGHERA